jgi:hypothetical protein
MIVLRGRYTPTLVEGDVATYFHIRKGIAEWRTWASGCMDDALADVSQCNELVSHTQVRVSQWYEYRAVPG